MAKQRYSFFGSIEAPKKYKIRQILKSIIGSKFASFKMYYIKSLIQHINILDIMLLIIES